MSILSGNVLAEGSGVTLIARILGNAGTPIRQADINSIAWTVTNLTLGMIVTTGTFVVATTVFDSLQTNDPRWRFDDVYNPGDDGLYGFNFLATIPAATFPVTTVTTDPNLGVPGPTIPGQVRVPERMQVDVAFTPFAGQPFRQVFLWGSLNVFG